MAYVWWHQFVAILHEQYSELFVVGLGRRIDQYFCRACTTYEAFGQAFDHTACRCPPVSRRLQESRHKRDDFLNQMTSFLEGIESKTTADVIPPEPPVALAPAESYTSKAFPPAAAESVSGKQVLWANAVQDRRASSGAASASSSLMQEDLFGETVRAKSTRWSVTHYRTAKPSCSA